MKRNIQLSIAVFSMLLMGCKTKVVSQQSSSNSQVVKKTIDLNEKIPESQKTRKGVLENGMTYYLHSTDINKDVASYYIIQNVGSILENENQRGLAHFLEHMAFNGTKSFPGKSMLNKLEENGLVFGRDINAYTGFDETVYNVNNIPTTSEMTGVGLQILNDWSNYLLLTDTEIDAERGVIREEWRTSQSGGMRIMEKNIGAEYGYSKYGERLPIGLMNIVDNFEYKALRDFYHDWYRTDLQAIAIIGDFNIDEMEAKVQEKFSKIPAVENPPKRYEVKIEDKEELDFSIAMDKEVAFSNLMFKIRQPKSLKDETVRDLRKDLLNDMVKSILNERFQELLQNPESPILSVGADISNLARLYESFDLYIQPKKNKQQDAFAVAMNELNRAVKFGFTKSEINRAITSKLKDYESEIASLEDRMHWMIIEGIKMNYLENKPIADVAKTYEITKAIYNNLKPEDVLQHLRQMYTDKNRVVMVTGVKGNNNITETQVKDIIKSAENNTSLKPYEDTGEAESLMAGTNFTPGTIASEKKNEALGFTTYTLSNGVKVHHKYVDKNKNDVMIDIVSDGGSSLVPTEDLPSAEALPMYLEQAGLGDFSSTELSKVLSGKTAMARTMIDNTEEKIMGFSTTKDVETLLQMVHLRFTKPRFDKKSYGLMMQNIEAYVNSKGKDPRSKMEDSLTVTVYGKNHPIKRIINKAYAAEISFEKMKAIYKSRFSNPSDFDFFIVGDIKAETLKPLLENYIASMPTTNEKEQWKDNTVAWQKEKIDKDIFLPMEDAKGTVNIEIKKDMPYNIKDKLLTSTLGKLLELRYTATLREEEGGTYGASTYAELVRKPRGSATISVNFDCNPELVDKLVSIVHQEMEKMKNGIISQEDLNKTKKAILKKRKDNKNNMDYDLTAMQNYILEGYNMELPENFEQIVTGITKNQIQDIAKRILTNNQSYEVVFKPLQ
ncbi:insulinase family protein [Flavivirga abyssicola]|uniref:M16 family metallopeptidase n=1 Tax=Flavivirga abyssicola TaxID=3063533 RepID=UPI0026E0FDC8|nr:M16 family metallopeptidase [Flavivirga sp. MEBiC07777]WVK12637.1 insulinase family protein [Flavivirga sp. MEBiC07777]